MKRRFEYIDALRGLAVLGVIVVHTTATLLPKIHSHFAINLLANGARGVQLFFIISAFTLFISMENKRKESAPTRNFFIRRFFRIAPLFYVAIIAYLLVAKFGPIPQHFTTWDITATALFLNGWHPYWINNIMGINWTVAVEMSFYLLLPFLFKKLKNLYDATFALIATCLALVYLNPFLIAHNPFTNQTVWLNFVGFWLPTQLPIFLLGIILYYLVFPKKNKPLKASKARDICSIILLGLVVVTLLARDEIPLTPQFEYGLVFLVLAYILSKRPYKVIVNRFSTYLGKISYSVYLTHILVLDLVIRTQPALVSLTHGNAIIVYTILIALTLSISMIVSTGTYYFIEKPGIIFGNNLIEKLERNQTEHLLADIMKTLNLRKRVSAIDRDTW